MMMRCVHLLWLVLHLYSTSFLVKWHRSWTVLFICPKKMYVCACVHVRACVHVCQRFPHAQDWRQGGNVSKVGGRPNFSIFPALHRVAPVCSYFTHKIYIVRVCMWPAFLTAKHTCTADRNRRSETKFCRRQAAKILRFCIENPDFYIHMRTTLNGPDCEHFDYTWGSISNMHGWTHCSASRRLFNDVI